MMLRPFLVHNHDFVFDHVHQTNVSFLLLHLIVKILAIHFYRQLVVKSAAELISLDPVITDGPDCEDFQLGFNIVH